MNERSQPSRTRPASGIRWWPLGLIVAALIVVSIGIWSGFGVHRQSRILATIAATGCAAILSFLWLLLFSRIRWRTRLAIGAAVVLVGSLLALSLEQRGVTGDVLPVLGWRWSGAGVATSVPEPERGAPDGDPAALDAAGAYPQFLGPRRDGTLPGVRLLHDWAASPPTERWRRPIGRGWSGFAVLGSFAVTQEQRGGQELVTCYDLDSGELIWVHGDPTRHDDPLGGVGPRATPTIVGDRVYALGATGILNALALDTGEPLWSVDVRRDNDATSPPYGVASSPLVLGEWVVVAAGGRSGRSLVAYDRESGHRVWSGGDDPAAYSSPILATLAGREQIVLLNARHLVGHDATDGAVLWQYPWPSGTENVSQPVVLSDDRVFVSTGYGVGGKMLRVTAVAQSTANVEVLWESRAMKAKLSNVVHRDGFLYGLDDGILACVDAESGERVWKAGRYGHGQTILVGDVLLIQAESGDVVLVRATPVGHRELARLEALDGKTWNHPALAGNRLLVRNDREAASYELALASGAGS
jgi:outer membrane protein assembly factor BamB